jgi:hypothetical protein
MGITPILAISQELVRFDLQALEQPDISGTEYQQGTLAGYEVRQYLLDKWNRACSYCGVKGIPLQIEHIHPRAKGGSNRVSNLCLACASCNQAKGTQDIAVFLAEKPELLQRILAQAKAPLKDAAAVNTTRWELYRRLQALGLPIECGTGGRTKFNRVRRGLVKAHWLDAACVGASTPETLHIQAVVPLLITANGHGCRQKCLMNELGFPRSQPKGSKKVKGFSQRHVGRSKISVTVFVRHCITAMGTAIRKEPGQFLPPPRTGRVSLPIFMGTNLFGCPSISYEQIFCFKG